MLYKSMF